MARASLKRKSLQTTMDKDERGKTMAWDLLAPSEEASAAPVPREER